MGDQSYNFSLTTFNPSGKLPQLESALKAVNQGRTALGIKAKNGVVIATDATLTTSLIEASSINKINVLTKSAGMTYAGLQADTRVLLQRGRKKAQGYYQTYHETQPTTMLTKELATIMQEFTQSGGVRPFGVSLLIAGYDDDGPQLFQVDPSGAYFGWKATALGKDQANAKTFLEKRYNDEMELEDAIHTALLTLREGFEGEMTEHNIEVAVIGEDRVFTQLSPAEIRDYLDEAE